MKKIAFILINLLLIIVINNGCGVKKTVKMATTTSVENSGILYLLLDAFERKFKIRIQPIPVGTGCALKLSKNADVDLVFVHAPKLEKEFVKKGFGVLRKEIMYNKFVIVGPKEDKAGIKNLNRQGIKSSVVDAFKKIARKRCLFISRGDNSGTHQKELDIWKQAGIFPRGTWYRETGQGMQETLIIADEKGAYCLVDKATFLLNEDKIDLVILFEKDPCLKNIYSVMATNPALHPHVRYKEAALFINWLSTEGKILIKNFRKRGKILFYCCD